MKESEKRSFEYDVQDLHLHLDRIHLHSRQCSALQPSHNSRMESRALRSSWSLLHGETKGREVKGEERKGRGKKILSYRNILDHAHKHRLDPCIQSVIALLGLITSCHYAFTARSHSSISIFS